MNRKAKSVDIVANGKILQSKTEPDGLHVMMPDHPAGEYAYALQFLFK